MNRILIISSSARAIADSADRGGYSFDVYDQFQDWDLQQICRRNPQNQNQIIAASEFTGLIESIDWVRYRGAVVAGGFENRLNDLRKIESKIQSFGSSTKSLNMLQSTASIAALRKCVQDAGGKWPETYSASSAATAARTIDSNWIVKDLRGSGGSHIRRIDEGVSSYWDVDQNALSSMIVQRLIPGDNISALYVAGPRSRIENLDNRSSICCQLIGCTEQLVGEMDFSASEFGYCGSVGPLALPVGQQQLISCIGQSIAEQFAITGIFGIDFIVNDAGIWPVDINARTTASAELFERHRRINALPPFSFFAAHLQACLGEIKPIEAALGGTVLAKGVVYCRDEVGLQVTHEIFQQLLALAEPYDVQTNIVVRQVNGSPTEIRPFIADVPKPDTFIPFGAPILTLFETGKTPAEAKRNLFSFAQSGSLPW